MSDLHNTTLLILGHGSSKHPESSASVRSHAEALKASGDFSDVRCAFLKEEPLVDHCLDGLDDAPVVVVPDFLAEGYFTRQVLPSKLAAQQGWKHCRCSPPVGSHPLMSELIEAAAIDLLDEWSAQNTSLLVIGHGSGKNACSKQTLLHHLGEIRARNKWGQVADLWLEEPPRVAEWARVACKEQVIVVPYLLNDGQHGGWDIPADLGIDGPAHDRTHECGAHELRLSPALGTSPRFTEVIAELARLWGGAS
ncbi:MAG: CbiX/SirB N-terminal domain-containing protein [Akkermansiaceae bacterium]